MLKMAAVSELDLPKIGLVVVPAAAAAAMEKRREEKEKDGRGKNFREILVIL